MNIELLYYFERKIYETLVADQAINSKIKSIDTWVQKNPRPPHILLSLQRFEEEPPYNNFRFRMRFNICLFNENYKLKQRLELTSSIKNIITPENFYFEEFEIVNLKCSSVEFIDSKDNNTTRSSMEFAAILQQSGSNGEARRA